MDSWANMHKSATQDEQKSHFSKGVPGSPVVKTGQRRTGEMISAGLTSSPQDDKTMLFPHYKHHPSSKHHSLQELARIPDFHSLETIVLQHFCIPSKYKDKVYYL